MKVEGGGGREGLVLKKSKNLRGITKIKLKYKGGRMEGEVARVSISPPLLPTPSVPCSELLTSGFMMEPAG